MTLAQRTVCRLLFRIKHNKLSHGEAQALFELHNHFKPIFSQPLTAEDLSDEFETLKTLTKSNLNPTQIAQLCYLVSTSTPP